MLPSVLRLGATIQPCLLLPSYLSSSRLSTTVPVLPLFCLLKSQILPGWKNLPSDPVLGPTVAAAANLGQASSAGTLWCAQQDCVSVPRSSLKDTLTLVFAGHRLALGITPASFKRSVTQPITA